MFVANIHVWNALRGRAILVQPPDQSVTPQQNLVDNACKTISVLILRHIVYQDIRSANHVATHQTAMMDCCVALDLPVILVKLIPSVRMGSCACKDIVDNV